MTALIVLAVAFSFTIINRLYAKKTLNQLDAYGVTVLSNVFCTLVLLPYAIYKIPEILTLSPKQWSLMFVLGALWAVTAWVINVSISLNDFSFKEIIRQTRVVFVVLGGVIFFGEYLTYLDMLGILAIIVSSVVISWRGVPLKEQLTSKPILLAWISSLLVATITLLEKWLIADVDVVLYSFIGAFAIPSIILLLFLNGSRRIAARSLLVSHKIKIALFSSFMLVAFVSGVYLYKILPISIAYPLIQSATVFTVVIGTFIFEDNKDWGRKLIAALIAVLGVIFIKL